MLHGHERAITQIKYSREGDLLFSCAKDHTPNVWYSLNGERLGTFNGHNGAVWCIDVNWDTTKVVSGAADNTCKLWDCETGKELESIVTKTAVRTCGFSYSGQELMYTTDKSMGKQCELNVVDLRQDTRESAIVIPVLDNGKITSALWGNLDESIISGHDNGAIVIWDLKLQEPRTSVREHKSTILDMQFNKDETMFITASKDTSSKLFDSESLEVLKTYKTERPVNSASISPIRDHVVLGGGQEAMDVTTTSSRVGKFDARFFHLVLVEEFGRVKDHFGPINSVAFHPDGKSYSSGGEDGYVRVHTFDSPYFEFQFEC